MFAVVVDARDDVDGVVLVDGDAGAQAAGGKGTEGRRRGDSGLAGAL